MRAARVHLDHVAKPLKALGRLEDVLVRLAGMAELRRDYRKCAVVMCADNGVVAEGVTQTGSDVTAVVAGNILNGKASVCCMAGVAVETFAPMQTSQYAGSFAAGKTKTQRRILLGMYIAVMLVVFLWLFSKPSCALAVAWAGLTTILACRLARRNLGGMSGDIAGFSITLGELSGLLILAIF